MRIYRLTRLFNCPPSALDNESAVQLDWLLAIDGVVRKAERTIAEREAR
jgi:hypothetical protein